MKKDNHPIDEFFRESLMEYKVTPSVNSRNRFLETAAGSGSKGSTGQFRWYYILSAVVVITTAALVLLIVKNHSSSPKNETAVATIINNSHIAQTETRKSPEKSSTPVPITLAETKTKTIINDASLSVPKHY